MRILKFIVLGLIAAVGMSVFGACAAQGSEEERLAVEVDAGATRGAADLEGLRGSCAWQLYGDPDHPVLQAWNRAGFRFPRGIFLSYTRVSLEEVGGQERGNASRSLVLDFGFLDENLAAAAMMNAEPLFLVASMPQALSSKPAGEESTPEDQSCQYSPTDYALWDEYVTRTVRHLVEKGYGGCYYEIWNEPEDYNYSWKGKPGGTKADTLTDYLELYAHTTAAIRAADPSAKVGGPVCAHWDSVTASGGIHAWSVPQFLRALDAYRREHPDEDVPLDFVSWHDYSFMSPGVGDGADFVDGIIAELKWPTRPEYLITEWNSTLGVEGVAGHERASYAAWNIIDEANSETRRITRAYWYVLDGGSAISLIDDSASGSSGERSCFLSATFAVFEMLGEMNRGSYLAVSADEPLAALATIDGEALRLMVCNNTKEARTASVALSNLPGELQQARCRVQLVDGEHSADGDGLEEGEETLWQAGQPVLLDLAPHATALVTIAGADKAVASACDVR